MIRVVLISVFIFGSVYAMEKPTGRPIFAPASLITPEQEAEVAQLPEQERKYKLRDFLVHNLLQDSSTLDEVIKKINELAKETEYKDILAFDLDYIKKYGSVEWLAQQQHTELNAIIKFYLNLWNGWLYQKNKWKKFEDFYKAFPGLQKLENEMNIHWVNSDQKIVALKQLAEDPIAAPFLNNYQLFEHIIKQFSNDSDLQIRIVTRLRTPLAAEFIKKNIKWSDLLTTKDINFQGLLFLVQNLPDIQDQSAQKKAAIIMLLAIFVKDSELVKLLLNKGFDPNVELPAISEMEVSHYYTTPLMDAIFRNSPEIVALLLEFGADPNILAYSVSGGYKGGKGDLPLIQAIRFGRPDIVQLLLNNPLAQQIQEIRAAQGAQSYLGLLPKEVAATAAEKVKPTLKADPNLMDGFGHTALNQAVSQVNFVMIQLLLDAGAQINGKDSRGVTPLMTAAELGKNLEIVKLLIDKGADPTLRDNEGRSALDYALYATSLWTAHYKDKQAILDYLKNILKERGEK